MNHLRQTVKLGAPPHNRDQRRRLRRVQGVGHGGAGLCARLETIQAGTACDELSRVEAGPTDT